MKNITIMLLASVFLALAGVESGASWLIDARKFHMSVHGQLSCRECHESIAYEDLHPDPSRVNRKSSDFFSIDQCLSCHDDVMDNLSDGVHGSKKVEAPKTYEACLKCHDPHYEDGVEKKQPSGSGGATQPAQQCGACHEPQTSLPEFFPEDENCLSCHIAAEAKSPAAAKAVTRLCFHCHGSKESSTSERTRAQTITGRSSSLINPATYAETPHAGVNCLTCHPGAADYSHGDQKRASCRRCHTPHHEKTIHDSHTGVACQSCHLHGVRPVRIAGTAIVDWEIVPSYDPVSRVHKMVWDTGMADGKTGCKTCHFKGNQVGAVSMVLPAKGILCMPCHTTTLSVGDASMVLALILFLAGLAITAYVWLSGARPGQGAASPFTRNHGMEPDETRTDVPSNVKITVKRIVRTLFYDVFLQRRLYHRSVNRWLIHGLIFYSLAFRFVWGIAGLFASVWLPEHSFSWALLNKNHPITGVFFDFTGLMMIGGVVAAAIRKSSAGPKQPPGLPKPDRLALGLVGGIVIVGFILEGMRIAMTGWPAHSEAAIVGYGLSLLFAGMTDLTDAYGYLWYLHALLTGAFVVYLPFSRLLHMIVAPVVLVINAADAEEEEKVSGGS